MGQSSLYSPSYTMDKMREVIQALGQDNYRLFIEEVRSGRIDKDMLQVMATKMGTQVVTVFEDKQGQSKPEFLARFMLDAWWAETLSSCADGPAELVNLLQDWDVGLKELANKMTKGPKSEAAKKELPRQGTQLNADAVTISSSNMQSTNWGGINFNYF